MNKIFLYVGENSTSTIFTSTAKSCNVTLRSLYASNINKDDILNVIDTGEYSGVIININEFEAIKEELDDFLAEMLTDYLDVKLCLLYPVDDIMNDEYLNIAFTEGIRYLMTYPNNEDGTINNKNIQVIKQMANPENKSNVEEVIHWFKYKNNAATSVKAKERKKNPLLKLSSKDIEQNETKEIKVEEVDAIPMDNDDIEEKDILDEEAIEILDAIEANQRNMIRQEATNENNEPILAPENNLVVNQEKQPIIINDTDNKEVDDEPEVIEIGVASCINRMGTTLLAKHLAEAITLDEKKVCYVDLTGNQDDMDAFINDISTRANIDEEHAKATYQDIDFFYRFNNEIQDYIYESSYDYIVYDFGNISINKKNQVFFTSVDYMLLCCGTRNNELTLLGKLLLTLDNKDIICCFNFTPKAKIENTYISIKRKFGNESYFIPFIDNEFFFQSNTFSLFNTIFKFENGEDNLKLLIDAERKV